MFTQDLMSAMSEEDVEKLEAVLSTEEGKKVLQTSLSNPNTPEDNENVVVIGNSPHGDQDDINDNSFFIDEEEANKILEVIEREKWYQVNCP